jgi:TRAP-type mannitol/chloroaromatic compound transport system permease large subunit
MQDRPRNLTYLAVGTVIASIVWLAAGLALMFGGTLGGIFGGASGGAVVVLGAFLIALAAVGLALGYGFWMKKAWAWTAGIVVFTTSIVLNVVTIFLGASVFSIVIPVAVSAAVLWYLFQPQVKSELRPAS